MANQIHESNWTTFALPNRTNEIDASNYIRSYVHVFEHCKQLEKLRMRMTNNYDTFSLLTTRNILLKFQDEV